MDIEKTIPEKLKVFRVSNINIILETNKAMVEIWTDTQRNRKEVDIESIIEFSSKEDVLVIKDFFNQIIATALDIEEIDIPDKLFEVNVININEK